MQKKVFLKTIINLLKFIKILRQYMVEIKRDLVMKKNKYKLKMLNCKEICMKIKIQEIFKKFILPKL